MLSASHGVKWRASSGQASRKFTRFNGCISVGILASPSQLAESFLSALRFPPRNQPSRTPPAEIWLSSTRYHRPFNLPEARQAAADERARQRPMTPAQFIAKWRASSLKERSAAQEHFIDLCRLLDEPTPAEADPAGDHYCFERGALKDSGGDGWADVWKRHCFAWEYKGRRANLDAAFD